MVYGDLICQLPQSAQFGHVWYQYNIFNSLFNWGNRRPFGSFSSRSSRCSSHTNNVWFNFYFVYVFLYSASLSTDKRSLQSECILSLLLLFKMDLSPSLSTSFTIVWVDVPLLSLECKFHFRKMLATLLFNDRKRS